MSTKEYEKGSSLNPTSIKVRNSCVVALDPVICLAPRKWQVTEGEGRVYQHRRQAAYIGRLKVGCNTLCLCQPANHHSCWPPYYAVIKAYDLFAVFCKQENTFTSSPFCTLGILDNFFILPC